VAAPVLNSTEGRPRRAAPTVTPFDDLLSKKKVKLGYLLRPHRAVLALAFLAVLGEAVTDLLEPWPLKIVFDYVFGTKHLPSWMTGLLGPTFGLNKTGILHFAIIAVMVIAVAGALSAYTEKYLTTSVGQWVMHDLRRVLYHHIQRLSLAYHDHKPTGDLISHAFLLCFFVALKLPWPRHAFAAKPAAKDSATCGGFDVADPARVIVPPQWQNQIADRKRPLRQRNQPDGGPR
jgi:hypothetical protein